MSPSTIYDAEMVAGASHECEYVARFLAELERIWPSFVVVEASLWVVTLLDSGTDLPAEEAARKFAAEYRGARDVAGLFSAQQYP